MEIEHSWIYWISQILLKITIRILELVLFDLWSILYNVIMWLFLGIWSALCSYNLIYHIN